MFSGILVLEFDPILAWYRFQLLKSLWSSLTYFYLMMWQMFSIGERSGLQAGQFSTQTLLLWSHAVVTAAVCGFALSCWNTQGLPWNTRRLEGSICCSKTLYTFQHSQCLPKHASCPYHMHLCTPIPSEMLAFELFEKHFYNLFTHTFTDWRASAHLYFWETLPLQDIPFIANHVTELMLINLNSC